MQIRPHPQGERHPSRSHGFRAGGNVEAGRDIILNDGVLQKYERLDQLDLRELRVERRIDEYGAHKQKRARREAARWWLQFLLVTLPATWGFSWWNAFSVGQSVMGAVLFNSMPLLQAWKAWETRSPRERLHLQRIADIDDLIYQRQLAQEALWQD